MRADGRKLNEIREVSIKAGIMKNAHGSVLISMGQTEVLCSAMIEEGVPPFLTGKGKGWLTAEYAMLPASTLTRKNRSTIKPDSRGTEIQRLIGRSLRSVCDFNALGENTIHIDCDVLSADGGTRTAAITGAFVALALCVDYALKKGIIAKSPIIKHLAAISAGIVNEKAMVDLCYTEDSRAQADMNFVAAQDGGIAELQICGEQRTLSKQELDELIALCESSVEQLINKQKEILQEQGIII